MKLFLLRVLLLFSACVGFSACGSSENDISILVEDSYNEGYLDALDCVKDKGGSAYNAAEDCEDE